MNNEQYLFKMEELYWIILTMLLSVIVLTLPCWAFYLLTRRIYNKLESTAIWLNDVILNKGIKYYIEEYQSESLDNVPVGANSPFDNGTIKLD